MGSSSEFSSVPSYNTHETRGKSSISDVLYYALTEKILSSEEVAVTVKERLTEEQREELRNMSVSDIARLWQTSVEAKSLNSPGREASPQKFVLLFENLSGALQRLLVAERN
ncbi:MAG: hypothetical protein UV82_C0013G0085 [Candidatus Magasanikbacteria bacterium GW2011_GWD2_43_18]|nr:MAG: hypothetical protein UV18_C0002G0062 [Candidatus Magasanikbacteria bacterium GW2011_GWC2_42_27]KKT04001.1 MAG: hypothetical protein UV82_C0013G0085 [Candidatus Magasanikbacteria bacterium GW2011_GWD2_43_18]KKT26019.1 MAG: hypothetical protein UW10_C0002G0019 [Candidatus Magasanikbacteria bacterium GW2011_GWA2_43_9]HBB37698.1 hypothetical protein [Candidatus Magasanikbacteria bacterium]HCC13300.1 hypothetical protein [Candidatus Magasanikbacteria bacterium]